VNKANRGRTPIVTDVVVYGVAFGVANVVSYCYIVIAGRTLVPAHFGVFNALLGVIGILGFLAASLQLAITQAAAVDPSRQALRMLMRSTLRIAAPAVAVLAAVAIFCAAKIGASVLEALLCAVVVSLILLAGTPLAFLAGIGRVRTQSGVNLLGTIARLGAGWPLMVAGFGVIGAVSGYVVNYAAVLLLAYWAAWRYAHARRVPESGMRPLRVETPTVATFVLALAPFSLDQIFVQVFAPALGGSYAGASTLAKLVFFGVYPIIAVAYPRLLRPSLGHSETRFAAATIVAVACIALVLAGVLAAFPREATALFFSDRFREATTFLGPLAFGVAAFSLSTVCAHLLVAWRVRYGFVPSLAALCVGLALFIFRHDTLANVVFNQVWIYALQLVFVSIATAMAIGRSIRRRHALAARAATGP
jgi:O-antigen/teichoic acid export membrane protein